MLERNPKAASDSLELSFTTLVECKFTTDLDLKTLVRMRGARSVSAGARGKRTSLTALRSRKVTVTISLTQGRGHFS
jgi:hypothetical protein